MFLYAALFLFSTTANGQRSDPHRHQQSFDAPDFIKSGVAKVAKPDKNLKKENFVRNQKYEGFYVYQEGAGYRIFFVERRTGKSYEILGVGQSHRPFSDLKWAGNGRFVFDSWANPHHGTHYEFDVQERKLKKVLIFRDDDSGK